MLLIRGPRDHVVPVEQSQAMARALQRAGKAHRHIEPEGGDHALSRYAHRLEFLQALEAFLDEHLSSPAAAAQSAPR
ncbi:alpha/beta hydrolase family protein [Caldimonas mangrovi]|uniref:alpha/beta hydrolase family protein n=1 Tax=Caldimonas mangrovi TaxID=2944811 RepID=UPI00387EE4E2